MMERMDHVITRTAQGLAMLGGAVLVLVVILSTTSIMGRWLGGFAPFSQGLGPVPGDYELIEMGVAAAMFLGLPLAQLYGAHARVDLLASRFGKRSQWGLDVMAGVLVCAITLVLAQQHGLGLGDKRAYHQTSFILQIPIWWGYVFGAIGLWGWFFASIWCVIRTLVGHANPSQTGATA